MVKGIDKTVRNMLVAGIALTVRESGDTLARLRQSNKERKQRGKEIEQTVPKLLFVT